MSSNPLPTDPIAWQRAAQRVVEFRREHTTKKRGKRLPLSQEALGEKAGVSQGCIQAFENGTRETRRESVEAIAKAIGLTVDELFAGVPSGAAHVFVSHEGLSVEAVAIGKLFTIAYTEIKTTIKHQLVIHALHRTDRDAVELIAHLRAAGLLPAGSRVHATPPPAHTADELPRVSGDPK